MLTDKCKIDFRLWLSEFNLDNRMGHLKFDCLHDLMKWGIYQKFFDQAGYDLVVFKWKNKYASNVYEIDGDKIGDDVTIGKDKGYKTRDLAISNVIKQANTIYNENISNTSL